MTKRQQQLAQCVARNRDEVIFRAWAVLKHERLGFEVQIRIMIGLWEGMVVIRIRKGSAGLEYVEDSRRFHRKGHTAPRWRPLTR